MVQHTDRLARGDGIVAEHLVGLLLWARRVGVCIRSVEDDSTGENLLMAVVMGERNYEDSKRKAAATAAGRRRAAERGEWCGAVPDGYAIERAPQGATILRKVVKNPERVEVYSLLWDMAREGATVNDIVREFRRRSFRTAPYRARPRSFDATRLGKVITNPFYAGLMVSQGEIIGKGHWPAYVEPDEWYLLRRERRERARHRPRRVGRPSTGLLAGLGRCSCGGALIQQRNGPRKDGSRQRTYVCRVHMHGAGACDVKPFYAEHVERMILEGLGKLLGDAGEWATALLAGRDAERAQLESIAADAAREATDAENSITRLADRYERALAAGDEAEVNLAKRAWNAQQQVAERAAVRRRAAEDALAATLDEPTEDPDALLARVWRSVAGDMAAAEADVAALNAVLRRYFDRFEIGRATDGDVRIVPVFSYDRALELVRQRFVERCRQATRTPAPFGDDWGVLARVAASLDRLSEPMSDVDPPGTQPPSHLPHNTRPGSSGGTAGGSPRRSRTGARGRGKGFRS